MNLQKKCQFYNDIALAFFMIFLKTTQLLTLKSTTFLLFYAVNINYFKMINSFFSTEEVLIFTKYIPEELEIFALSITSN